MVNPPSGGNQRRSERRSRGNRWEKVVRYALVILGACLLVFGLVGFLVQSRTAQPPSSFWQAGYQAVQLFVLNSGAEGRDNIYLVIARLAAIGFVALGVARVLATIYRDAFDDWRLRWVRRHAVIFGLGQIGIQLCRDLRARPGRTKVVAVERDESNPHVRLARELGAIVQVGDARDPELLEPLHLERAQLIFAVTGSDSTNVEVAIRSCELLAAERAPGDARREAQAPVGYVHIADPARTDLLKRHPVFSQRMPELEVRLLNVFERSAWQLVVEQIACHRPQPIPGTDPQDYEAAHYAIVGFGLMGQAVALTAARLAQFENRKRLRLTILDENIESLRARFLARYPRFGPEPASAGPHGLDLAQFDPAADAWSSRRYRPARRYWCDDPRGIEYACNAEFLPIAGDVHCNELLDALADRLGRPDVRPGVIVCLDDDARNFDAALALHTGLRIRCPGVQVYAWLPAQPGLAELLSRASGSAGKPAESIIPFGQCEKSCRLGQVFRPDIESFARGIHEDYRSKSEWKGPEWENLPAGLRVSNYLAAEHVEVKLRMMGLQILSEERCSPGRRVDEFKKQDLLLLAKIEHNRWLAERLIDGWGYEDLPESDPVRKKNPWMIPWECLPDSQRAKDIAQVQLIPELVNELRRRRFLGESGRWCIGPLDG